MLPDGYLLGETSLYRNDVISLVFVTQRNTVALNVSYTHRHNVHIMLLNMPTVFTLYSYHHNVYDIHIILASYVLVTMCDFWAMVYQEGVSHIVFMARLTEDGIVKCEQYWPDAGLETYGHVTVRHVASRHFADFSQRTFDISAQGLHTQRVTQYQFTAWPDHGTPEDPIPLYEFRTMIRARATAGPLLVHCGTGVSRAAVFIAVDSLLEQAREEHVVNVFNFCNKMRR